MIAIFSILFVVFYYLKDNYIYNMTPSIPIGFYKIEKISNQNDIKVGDIIVFNISLSDKAFLIERGYISKRTKALMKKISAKEGDIVEVDNFLKINGKIIKKLKDKDIMGKNLPLKKGKFQLKEGEYFLIGDSSNSFDSCYLGIIKDSQFLFKVKQK
ncbi:S26 family signal peptidase [Fusobacterium sp. SYSU M8D902]|uniref:S26 family signal peptidase n=1 Tax=Fusobacterium sp. SYSU M8D902 TaxID=3159562 RepID=UPI0032E43425